MSNTDWRGHTIVAAMITGAPAAQVYVGQKRATTQRFSGATLEAAVDAAKLWVDAKLAASSATRRLPHVPAATEFADYFMANKLSKPQLLMLAAHVEAGSLSISELAEAAGWKNYQPANANYGKLGHAIAATFGIEQDVPTYSSGVPLWTSVLASGSGDDPQDPKTWIWMIHPELIDGLKVSGLVA